MCASTLPLLHTCSSSNIHAKEDSISAYLVKNLKEHGSSYSEPLLIPLAAKTKETSKRPQSFSPSTRQAVSSEMDELHSQSKTRLSLSQSPKKDRVLTVHSSSDLSHLEKTPTRLRSLQPLPNATVEPRIVMPKLLPPTSKIRTAKIKKKSDTSKQTSIWKTVTLDCDSNSESLSDLEFDEDEDEDDSSSDENDKQSKNVSPNSTDTEAKSFIAKEDYSFDNFDAKSDERNHICHRRSRSDLENRMSCIHSQQMQYEQDVEKLKKDKNELKMMQQTVVCDWIILQQEKECIVKKVREFIARVLNSGKTLTSFEIEPLYSLQQSILSNWRPSMPISSSVSASQDVSNTQSLKNEDATSPPHSPPFAASNEPQINKDSPSPPQIFEKAPMFDGSKAKLSNKGDFLSSSHTQSQPIKSLYQSDCLSSSEASSASLSHSETDIEYNYSANSITTSSSESTSSSRNTQMYSVSSSETILPNADASSGSDVLKFCVDDTHPVPLSPQFTTRLKQTAPLHAVLNRGRSSSPSRVQEVHMALRSGKQSMAMLLSSSAGTFRRAPVSPFEKLSQTLSPASSFSSSFQATSTKRLSQYGPNLSSDTRQNASLKSNRLLTSLLPVVFESSSNE
ncbi:uncharacterized protein MONOS_6645 [Monocercomonoides exilis]|uniref:uncharacterized protein n=1 Tax=Monocercomonoides exilis TaxID=2049356 RepID=UPI003559F3A8|nr:hypothetical protein MONOS_6645 [Monocercomonoides exilis]|eukprot:MONOS_6645.1-p1 / transcript=MONOS_6645.1 / gene=MONOS_6645 / organism=Monocercomonoides_exilis_PA203 / gene_product=unspecified product / transcript_product=unspecified product / location=Mono_scaffold00213:10628-12493(-) / protein_length=622 / sequence_SO=supercontig / SO=protein_coding / is_pseudo=false